VYVLSILYAHTPQVLGKLVQQSIPDEKVHVAIGGFLMLRFVCPCFVAPESSGLDVPPADRRRGLVLLSKGI
jgi:neurofibromin 1